MEPQKAPPRPQKVQGPLSDGALVDRKYQVMRLLGAGAMGAVYEAEHTGTGRRVALKVIMGQFAKDEGLVARFVREARAAGSIETQHITQVLDTGFDQESELPFMVMEFLEGEDVQQLAKRVGPLHPDLALRIVAQACLGLQKAHDKSVVHRDIKPANLFLAKRDAGEVIIKLLDFGIAKIKMEQAQETESAGLTKTGNMLGSPLYMSPEQARGARSIDHRTDVWSLGVVLYQLLCGKTPFQHLTALGELIISICSSHPQPVQERAPWVPAEVAAIAHRAMRHDPAQRYQSAMEMFQDIKVLLPNGWNISDEMFAPLSSTAREQQAPKAMISMPPPPPMATMSAGQTGGDLVTGTSAAGLSGSGAGARTGDPSATATSMATHAGTQPGGRGKGLVVGVTLGAVALLGGVGYFLFKPGDPPVVVAQPTPPVESSSPTPGGQPPPLVSSSPLPAVAPADVTPRRFKLVVEPKDVKVEVDGQIVPSPGGIVDITGPLGSTKIVKISKGKREYTTDVAITDVGLLPVKVELLAPGQAKPSSSASSAPAPVQPPITPAPVKTVFE